jgi:hypothetical protein
LAAKKKRKSAAHVQGWETRRANTAREAREARKRAKIRQERAAAKKVKPKRVKAVKAKPVKAKPIKAKKVSKPIKAKKVSKPKKKKAKRLEDYSLEQLDRARYRKMGMTREQLKDPLLWIRRDGSLAKNPCTLRHLPNRQHNMWYRRIRRAIDNHDYAQLMTYANQLDVDVKELYTFGLSP